MSDKFKPGQRNADRYRRKQAGKRFDAERKRARKNQKGRVGQREW